MRRRQLLLGAAAAGLAAPARAGLEPPADLLAAIDRVRNPQPSFALSNSLTEFRAGQVRSRAVLDVYSKLDPASGQYRNLVVYREPAREAGKALLMDGRLMWFHDPASNASVRISPQQRLLGQASNGDALNINLAAHYSLAAVQPETVRDADKAERATWHLDLSARVREAFYERVEYWVDRDGYQPVMARVYGDSGRALKTLYYRRTTRDAAGTRPTEAIIVDLIDATLVTRMVFGAYQVLPLPETLFRREALQAGAWRELQRQGTS